MRLRFSVLIACLLVFSGIAVAADDAPLLATWPTISKTEIAFVYGGYLWSVPREGGEARKVTTGGHESSQVFSPDGRWIAFSGEYDGSTDVYVMPAQGGEPRRLTWHPAQDSPVEWTRDGKRVLFISNRDAYADITRLYTVPVAGGVPEALPMWRGVEGTYSPDGAQFAYVPNLQWQRAWKRYRGGQTTPIYIVKLADLTLERVPRESSNDSSPQWVGDTVYFLSDRNGPVTLFAYDAKAKTVKQVIANNGLDFKSFSAGPDALVYEQFGGIYLLDPTSGKSKKVDIRISGDLPATRPHYEKMAQKIMHANLSPTCARAVFEAHGEILTVPAEKWDIRNLTRSNAVADRDPAWSPDGKWIAYFSDESGEYALHLASQTGLGPVKKINLENPPSYFYNPRWSPDSKKIAYTDKRLNLWYVDIDKGAPVRVDTDRYEDPTYELDPAWSPDSKWLTYSKYLPNHLRSVFLYSLDTGKNAQITDGLGDARMPVFDKGGKTLFFAASTDVGLSAGWLDLSSFQHPVSRSVYAVVLKKGDSSPVEPQSDEEKVAGEKEKSGEGSAEKAKESEKSKEGEKGKEGEKKEEPVKVTIDLDGIGQRIVALPVKGANYVVLEAGKTGTLFLVEIPEVPSLTEPTTATVTKFDLTTRKTEPVLGVIGPLVVSLNGVKVLYRQGPGWFIAATAGAPKPGEGAFKLGEVGVYVEPRTAWNQMYHEVWRIQRDFLYDPNHHGLDLAAAERKYAPYVKGVGGRADLNYLFGEMLGEITIGHMFIFGGDIPEAKKVKGGLLGADYKIENGRYRFARVYNGENWNPELRAPLTQPGVDVKAGDYLLEVEGREVRAPAEVYSFFEKTGTKQIKMKGGR